MRRVFVPCLLILLALPGLAERKPPPRILVLTNVTVIDVGGGPPVRGLTVVIRNDRIEAISKRAVIHLGRNVQVVNATGKFLIPGLWDMHVHVGDDEQSRRAILPLFLANGITGIRIMEGALQHHQWRKEIESGRLLGPRLVIASHILDGPKSLLGDAVILNNAAEARAAVGRAADQGADFIKVHDNPSREVYFAILEEAKRRGLPAAGHVPGSLSPREASEAGQKSIEHLTREIGPELDASGTAAMLSSFARNRTWQVPTLVMIRAYVEMDQAAAASQPLWKYLSPSQLDSWNRQQQQFGELPPDERARRRETFTRDQNLVREMKAAGIPILAGTDNGNPYCVAGFSLHQELELLVQAGLSPAGALRTATLNPGAFLGQSRERGAVEKGRVADLVLLDANPLEDIRNTGRIYGVVKGGKYFSRRDLDRILADLERLAGESSTGP